MPNLGAGELRDRVSVIKKESTPDGQGGRVSEWVDLVTGGESRTRIAARVLPARMSEQLQAAAIGSRLSYRITMRYRAEVSPTMRIEWTPFRSDTTKTFEIHGVQPVDGERSFIVCDCSEVV